jgi:integrase
MPASCRGRLASLDHGRRIANITPQNCPSNILSVLSLPFPTWRHYWNASELTPTRLNGIIAPTVFRRNGKPILAYLDAWRAACKRASTVKRAGLESVVRPKLIGRTPHDFRRTAARNLIRAGVAQHVVMQLCGWKTDAMFRRYAIVDERDLRSAVEMLARGTIGGQSKMKALRSVG